MKLRTQNMIVILPVFMGAILIMGGSKYVTQRDEMIWWAQNEMASLAVSIAEFVNPHVLFNSEKTGFSEPGASKRFVMALDRIHRAQSFRHLSIYSGEGARLLYSMGDDPIRPIVPLIHERLTNLKAIVEGTKPIHDAIGYAEIAYYAHDTKGSEPETMIALAPVSDGRGHLIAIVAIEKDASEISIRLRWIVIQLIVAGIVILFVGFLAASLVSKIIVRPIQRLTNAIVTSIGGQWNQHVKSEPIREFDDLNNTYNTMVSVLTEVESRLTRNMIQREFFFTKDNISTLFQEVFFPSKIIEDDQFIAHSSIHGESAIHFFDLDRTDNGLWAVVCRLGVSRDQTIDAVIDDQTLEAVLVAPNESNIDVAIASFSVSVLIRNELCHGKPDNAFKNVSRLFEIDYFHCIHIEEGCSDYTSWTLDSGKNELIQTQHPLEKGLCVVLHTFDNEVSEQIAVYARFFSRLAPDKLMKEILNSLGEETPGSIVVIKKV